MKLVVMKVDDTSKTMRFAFCYQCRGAPDLCQYKIYSSLLRTTISFTNYFFKNVLRIHFREFFPIKVAMWYIALQLKKSTKLSCIFRDNIIQISWCKSMNKLIHHIFKGYTTA